MTNRVVHDLKPVHIHKEDCKRLWRRCLAKLLEFDPECPTIIQCGERVFGCELRDVGLSFTTGCDIGESLNKAAIRQLRLPDLDVSAVIALKIRDR